jgi:predicted acetyltransferase
MSPAYSYGPAASDDERDALIDIQCQCFRATRADIAGATARAGDANVRVVRSGDRVVGGLWLVPMGQFFGGRSVPTAGIAGVGIDPAERGRGAASALMADALAEQRRDGVALSTLYPATLPLYRRAGYELAGCRWLNSIPLASLAVRCNEPALRLAGPEDFAAMEDCYRRFASGRAGYLDRGAYIWQRVRAPKGVTARHFVVEEQGRVEGHVTLTQVDSTDGGFYDLALTDAVATTSGAARRLLAFLSSHASMARNVSFHGCMFHPLLAQVPEWLSKVELALPWMLRIVDITAALEARGYARGLALELQLSVVDDVLPENTGRYRLLVEDGVGKVEPGGHGGLSLDVRGLAALYSGRATPDELRLAGLADGEASDRELAATVFAGPAPSMSDMF